MGRTAAVLRVRQRAETGAGEWRGVVRGVATGSAETVVRRLSSMKIGISDSEGVLKKSLCHEAAFDAWPGQARCAVRANAA